MRKVHIILDQIDKEIVNTVKQLPSTEVVQWDFSFDTAYEWTLRNQEASIDVYLASEYTQVSTIDQEGKQIPRDTALLKRITDLYLLRPQAKFLLLCDPDRALPENRRFLCSLVSIGIYDFVTDASLTKEKLKDYITSPKKDITHVQEYLPSSLKGTKSDYSMKKTEIVDTEETVPTEGFGTKIMDLFNKKIKTKLKERPKKTRSPKPKPISQPTPQPQNIEVLTPPQPRDPEPTSNIYAYGLSINEKGVVCFQEWKQMQIAADLVPPQVVILASKLPNLAGKIKRLQKNYPEANIIVVGSTDNAIQGVSYQKKWTGAVAKEIKKVLEPEAVQGTQEQDNAEPIQIFRPGRMRTTVLAIAGVAPRVGATSFCQALAGHLKRHNYNVEILDTGGGAIDWLREGQLVVRKAPPFSVVPGVITLIDAGTQINSEVQPFIHVLFVVTDLARSSINLKRFVGRVGNTYLVGNRNAPLPALKELGALWNLPVLGSLAEDNNIKRAELEGGCHIPRKWHKELEQVRNLLTRKEDGRIFAIKNEITR